MELQEIKDFLNSKPGYKKEGAKRLRNHLRRKGFATTIHLCKEALRQVRSEQKEINKKIETGEARILYYDIETSWNEGWFWRPGYNQRVDYGQITKERAVICVSYSWLGEDQVFTLAWDKYQNDRFLIEQFVEVLNEADIIVAHNGDKFDLRWLRGRAAYHRIPMLPRYKQIDTMKIAKKQMALNSYALAYLAEFFNLSDGKIKTRPNLWQDVCLKNDRKALEEMIEYCEQDVVVLEKVHEVLKMYETPKLHAGTLQGKTKQTSPINGGVNIKHVKTTSSVAGTIKHIMQDIETKRFFEMSDTNYRKFKAINK